MVRHFGGETCLQTCAFGYTYSTSATPSVWTCQGVGVPVTGSQSPKNAAVPVLSVFSRIKFGEIFGDIYNAGLNMIEHILGSQWSLFWRPVLEAVERLQDGSASGSSTSCQAIACDTSVAITGIDTWHMTSTWKPIETIWNYKCQ